jgi:phosphonate transport system substrate-binding protein
MGPRARVATIAVACAAIAAVMSSCGRSASPEAENVPAHSPIPATESGTVVVMAASSLDLRGTARSLAARAAYLEERLGIRVRIRVLADPQIFQARLREDAYDLVDLAPFDYVRARQEAGVEPIAGPDRSDSITYRGLIVTTAPGLRSLQDLRGRRVAYVDLHSASGYLYPLAMCLDAGIDPFRDFASFTGVGSHANVLIHLMEGRYDAGFTYPQAYADHVPEAERARVRIIAETPLLPNWCIAFSRSFAARDPALAERIRAALLAPDARTGSRHPFRAVSDTEFASVLRVASTLSGRGRLPE